MIRAGVQRNKQEPKDEYAQLDLHPTLRPPTMCMYIYIYTYEKEKLEAVIQIICSIFA